jgi:hypothetical protein
LSNGTFSSLFEYIFDGPGMENVGMICGHLENITAIWYMSWPLGNFVVIWYIFPRFGILYQDKSGNPGGRAIFASE